MYDKHKILVIGGFWDSENGSPSIFLEEIYNSVVSIIDPKLVTYINGGCIKDLEGILKDSDARIIISYINFDTSKYQHLSLRKYKKNASIYVFRKNHHQLISDYRKYILYSKSDGLIEILDDEDDDNYQTRLILSTGVVGSKFTFNLNDTMSRVINEATSKLSYGRVKYHRMKLSDTLKFDDLDRDEVNLLVKSIPDAYEVAVRCSDYPEDTLFYSKKVNNFSVIKDYDRSGRLMKFLSEGCSPSGSAFIYKYLMDTYSEIHSISRSWNYYCGCRTSKVSPVINSYSSLFVLDQLFSECDKIGNEIICIPGQGSYIIDCGNGTKRLRLYKAPNSVILDNTELPEYNKYIDRYSKYPRFDDHKDYLLYEVNSPAGFMITNNYEDLMDEDLFRVI